MLSWGCWSGEQSPAGGCDGYRVFAGVCGVRVKAMRCRRSQCVALVMELTGTALWTQAKGHSMYAGEVPC